MKELGLTELIPAMCQFDYTMSEAGGVTNFVREYTWLPADLIATAGIRKSLSNLK